jgi:hypothetical protein
MTPAQLSIIAQQHAIANGGKAAPEASDDQRGTVNDLLQLSRMTAV